MNNAWAWVFLLVMVLLVRKQLIDREIISRRMNRQVKRNEQPALFWTIAGVQFAIILCLLGMIAYPYIKDKN